MEKLVFKTLTSESEFSQILDKIEQHSGVRLPLDYIKDAKVVGVFLHNQLSASYMLVTKPDFRSLMFVPDQIKQSSKFQQMDSYEMMEINGLWIGPALKKPMTQIRVWMHLIRDILSARKKYILLMRNTRTKSMKKFMEMANPIELFEGSPTLLGGAKTHEKIQVSYTTRLKIVLNAHKYLLELWDRQRRADAFSKQRNLIRSLKQSEANFV